METQAPPGEPTGPLKSEPPKLSWLDRAQPLLLLGSIVAGLGLWQAAPDVAQALAPLINVGVFALIFLVMVGVDVQSVASAFSERKFLLVAVSLNFVVNPLMAWGLATVFLRGQPELWAGLILFLVTPCIGWYLIFTEHAGGDASLGVSLLAINVVLQVLLLPVYLYIFAGSVVPIEISTVVSSALIFLLAPILLAVATRRGIQRSDSTVNEVQRQLRISELKTGVLMGVIVAMFASEGGTIFDNPGVVLSLIPPVSAFFAIAFAIALGAGRVMNMPYEQTALLAFTTTSRNSEASLAIAATVFASPLVPLAVVIGPVIELPLLVIMVRVLLRKHRATQGIRG